MTGRLGSHLALLAAIWLSASPARAITFGQLDDFQDGTTEMWVGGSLQTNQPTGGPSGEPGDRYLELSTGGQISQLGTRNDNQWAGDYVAAGVTRINMALNNIGPQSVSLRLMIATDTTPGSPCSGPCTAWTSTNATVLPAASGWVSVEFSLAEVDLTRVAGAHSHATSLASVTRLHLRHDGGPPSPPGSAEGVNSKLGIDNVVALPEPAGAPAVLAGVALLLLLRLPRGKSREARKRNSHRVVRVFLTDSIL